MRRSAANIDEIVDQFVVYLNEAGFIPRHPDDVPEDLRTAATEDGQFHWLVKAASLNPWVEELCQRLAKNWPTPFQSLISRYRFCDFEVGPLMFFANSGHDLFCELPNNIFKDKAIFPTLHTHGLLQFGRPSGGSYDPACFDMQRRGRTDAPIVRIDHEEILLRKRIRVVEKIAPSFVDFMERAIAEKFPVH